MDRSGSKRQGKYPVLRQAGLELSAELGFHIPPAWQQLAGIKTQ
jgi:hypothetical protein